MVDAAALRTKMVDGQVRPNDVTDHRIIEAMLSLPREAFVPEGLKGLAYLDRDLRLGDSGRSLVQAMVQARLLQQAGIRSTDRVLVVGAGSGYLAALAGRLAATVIALEEDAALAGLARSGLAATGSSTVEVVEGALAKGWAAAAPYDVILVEGAVEVLPAALTDQLADGGRLLAIVGIGQSARLMLYTRSGPDVGSRALMNASAPLLPGFSPEPTFQF